MKAKSKALLLVVAANALLAAFAWGTVTGWIRSVGLFVDYVTMVLSVPGWALAIAIWGWNSPESVWADALIIATNTFVYSIAGLLLYGLLSQVVAFLNRRMWAGTE